MLKTDIEAEERFNLDATPLSLEKFNDIAFCNGRISFVPSQDLKARLDAGANAVTQVVQNEQVVYGVTTGFGAMANQCIPSEDIVAHQNNLLSFLAASCGTELNPAHVRGAMLLRANVLAQGKSGVRIELIERLIELLNNDAVPVVREHGSIGASGDLLPLSTIARAVTGHPHVFVRIGGEVVDGATALQVLGLETIELHPKEGLALVNGTSFSAAIAANATVQTRNLLAVSFAAQALMMAGLQVDCQPFDAFVHQAKPHPGQVWSASIIRHLVASGGSAASEDRIQVQDCYSLRCFPQYMGSIVEDIARIGATVSIEMNSVSDNPLVDPENSRFYQSGNFLGQYVATAMDDLRRDIGLLAKHLDVQIAMLVAPEFNRGLSASLRGNDQLPYNMGLKGLQICGNSIMPMLTFYGQPLTHHFPTHAEQFNQNINGLSWGSANLAWKSVETFSQYLAISLIFGVQAVDLKAQQLLGHFDGSSLLGNTCRDVYFAVCELLDHSPSSLQPFLVDDSDRWLEKDIEILSKNLMGQGDLIRCVQPILDSFRENFEAEI